MTDETSAPTPDQAASSTEIVPAATPTKGKDPEKSAGKGKKGAVLVGTAVGVGSAAIVAALMYANKRRK